MKYALEPNAPLPFDVQFADVVVADDGALQLRLKGTGPQGFGPLYLDWLEARSALNAAGLLEREPSIPDDFPPAAFQPVKLASRRLRLTRQVDTTSGVETLTIAARDPLTDNALYTDSTKFVLKKVLPLYREAGIPVGDVALAAMVHTHFLNRTERMGARRGY